MSRLTRPGAAYGLGSGVCWGLDAVLLGVLLAQTSLPALGLWAPLCLVAWHDLCSAVWLGIYRGRAGLGEMRRALGTGSGRLMVLAAWCGGPVGMSCYLLAIHYAGAGTAAVVSSLYPIVGVWLALICRLDAFRRHMGAGLALAVVSMMALGAMPTEAAHLSVGVVFGLGCALGWGAECVICAYGVTHDVSAETALQIRQTVSGLTYAAAVIPLLGLTADWAALATDVPVIIGVALTALVGTMSYQWYYRAIAALGPIRAMGLNISYSAWAVAFGAVAAGVWPEIAAVVAALGVMAGAWWTAAPWAVWKREWSRLR